MWNKKDLEEIMSFTFSKVTKNSQNGISITFCTLIYKLVFKNKFIHDSYALSDFKTQLSTLRKEHLYDGTHLSISLFFYITCIKAFWWAHSKTDGTANVFP